MLSDRHYMRPKRSGMVDGVSPVTAILWINIAVFILQHVFNVWTTPIVDAATGQPVINRDTGEALTRLQGSVSLSDLAAGKVYLLITSMFVHGGILHIVGNMLIVFFFGSRLLEFFGPKHFLGVYFLGGIGGALLQLSASAPGTPLIGASGGAFALVCAFATILPEMEIVAALYFVVPVRLKMKYLGLGLAFGSLVLAILSRVFGWWGDIGHLAHLGGCLVG